MDNKFIEFQHQYNPLHFYSRLRDMEITKKKAKKFSRKYEMLYNRIVKYKEKTKKLEDIGF